MPISHHSLSICLKSSHHGRWLRFRRYRDGRFVAFLPSGKIVIPDKGSEVIPRKPGHYYAAKTSIRPTYAIASLVRAHRNLKFRRKDAFGATESGVSYLLSYSQSRRKRLPFVCDPNEERLGIFGYDEFKSIRADDHWRYYCFRHGQWRLLNWYGPSKMPDEEFAAVQQRVRDFVRRANLAYIGSESTVWSAARNAGVVNDEEENEARRRGGPMWNYAGD